VIHFAAGEKKKRAALAMSSTPPMRWRGIERLWASATSCVCETRRREAVSGVTRGRREERADLGEETSHSFGSGDGSGSNDLYEARMAHQPSISATRKQKIEIETHIRPHSLRTQLDRKNPKQRIDTRLRRRDVRLKRSALVVERGGDCKVYTVNGPSVPSRKKRRKRRKEPHKRPGSPSQPP
jgi:hypothetical protein